MAVNLEGKLVGHLALPRVEWMVEWMAVQTVAKSAGWLDHLKVAWKADLMVQ